MWWLATLQYPPCKLKTDTCTSEKDIALNQLCSVEHWHLFLSGQCCKADGAEINLGNMV